MIMISMGVIVLFSIIVWFFVPTSGGIKGLIIALMALAGLARPGMQWAQLHKGHYLQEIRTRTLRVVDTLKRWMGVSSRFTKDKMRHIQWRMQDDKNNRQLKKTPWYLVMGSPKSGKRQMIENSGLPLFDASFYGREAVSLQKQYSDYQWFFSDEAVFLDPAIIDDDGNSKLEKPLLKLLRRHNKSKPLSGIVFTFSVAELLLAKHDDRRRFIQNFSNDIKFIHKGLKTAIPIYIVFTKADLICGFSEFFSDMSKEDLAQVWGVTFPLDRCCEAAPVIAFFQKEYNQLMARLQQRVLWSLDSEKKQEGRDLIYSFPQQMQLFRKPIATFIEEMFFAMYKKTAIQLRGLYFSSALQQGEPYDFFLHIIGKRYALKGRRQAVLESHNESYFLYQLFNRVILPESKILGFSQRHARVRTFLYRAAWVLAPLSVMSFAWAYDTAYHESTVSAQYVLDNVTQFQLATNKLSPTDDDLVDTLPALNALHQALISASATGMSTLLFPSYALYGQAKSALNRGLHSVFLPRVAANIESSLDAGGMDTNELYANLKGYLAFSPSHYTEPTAIKAPMELKWAKAYPDDPRVQNNLRYYISRAAMLTLDPLPLDRPLINKVRLELQEVVPSRRAYALLTIKGLASDYPDIDLSSVVGEGFKQIFTQKTPLSPIPSLYTKKGYSDIYESSYESIASQVSNDNKEIGLAANEGSTQSYHQIVDQVEQNYNDNYVSAWNAQLEDLQVRPFSSFKQAGLSLALLSGSNSPITKLLNIISANTYGVDGENIGVAKKYKPLNAFSETGLTQSELLNTQKVLVKLYKYMVKIDSAANVNQSAFNAAVMYMKGSPDNPISQLSVIAKNAPYPLSGWLHSIADNSWQLVLKSSRAYINTAWKNNVLVEYGTHVRDHYPLVENAPRQLSIESFLHFFSVQGTLNTFFTTYLAPFVNTSTKSWSLYVMNGHSLELPENDLDIFKRMKMIQNLYFDQNTKKPRLNFSIKPIMLDRHAREVDMIIGGQRLVYAHGPQQPLPISWPLSVNMQSSKVMLSDFSGRNTTYSSYGAWSVFKIFQNSGLHVSQDGAGYIFTLTLGGHHAEYEILSDAPIAAFKLSGISGFRLPSNL
jgi:type VI secretion system protein ImpL